MEETCPRCGATLSEAAASFCANCGLQQLRVSEDAIAVLSESAAPVSSAQTMHVSAKADWRFALRCAGAVALVGGVLQALSMRIEAANAGLVLWVMIASLVTIVTYRRGRPTLPMSAGMGARLGFTTSVLMITLILFVVAIWAFVLRFQYHSHLIDDAMQMWIEQAKAQRPVPPEAEAMWKLPEFRGGMVLTMTAFVSGIIAAVMSVTGALAGALFSGGQRSMR